MKDPIRLSALAWLLLSVAAFSGTVSGKIESINETTVTLNTQGKFSSFHLPPGVTVTLNGQPAKLSQLTAGMTGTVTTGQPGVAAKISGMGSPSAPAPDLTRPGMPAKPIAAATPKPASPTPPAAAATPATVLPPKPGAPIRELLVAVAIPGADALKVADGAVWFEHVSPMRHGMPTGIAINSVPWKPAWTERVSSRYTGPTLAPFAGAEVTVTQVSGRSTMQVDPPSAANQNTLTVTLTDSPVGSGENVIRIKW